MPSLFLDRLGIRQPLVLAPMSGASTPALVAAVSNAGGLGSHGAGYLAPQTLLDDAARIRELTDQPFALNLFVLPDEFHEDQPAIDFARATLDTLMEREGLAVRTSLPERWAPRFSDQFAALCEARPAVASFTFNLLTPAQLRELKRLGITVVGTATTVAEARAWAELGVDAVSLQGAEAGGHRGTFLHEPEEGMIGLFALLPLAARAVEVPLLAGGGIMDGRAMLAAELLGATVSQLGTAFLACPESSAAAAWKQDLPTVDDTRVTTIRSFSGRPARGLRNRYVDAMRAHESRFPAYPVMNALTAPLRRAAAAAGRGDLISEWCGQAASMSRAMPAAALVETLLKEYAQARDSLA
ncbi:NAD(P)H-dependent flavin oxidoreductase [Dyella soli]|uniref:Nitronate monooxygenase n=1 Tax=Dyella soli TaxID=522319 RepID=A0A4R0YPE9_9GAMM|nr:nitronate monooxygenase [Dyella soli]TCI10817.1 nitronate monooxygenase [Dyella soli]